MVVAQALFFLRYLLSDGVNFKGALKVDTRFKANLQTTGP